MQMSYDCHLELGDRSRPIVIAEVTSIENRAEYLVKGKQSFITTPNIYIFQKTADQENKNK